MPTQKLKHLKNSAFRTHPLKTPRANSELKPYYFSLCLFGLALLIFYYFFLKNYGGSYHSHYYEYYTRAIAITDSLIKLDFSATLNCYLESFVDKILIFRSVPFFLLFGPSAFVFFYSNVFFSLLLLLILFHSLLKIMHPEKALVLTLFILSQYFFVELLASFYVDLSFFLACSIFFIYLLLFDKNPRQYNLRLSFIILLLFLIKNVSYPLVPIISILFMIYFWITKSNSKVYILRLAIILAAGWLMYYFIGLGGSHQRLITDLNATVPAAGLWQSQTLASAGGKIFKSFGLFKNAFLLHKFPVLWFNLILYPVVIFVVYKKREWFWAFLFLISEFFFFIFYNIKGHHYENRYFLPFYFVYLYFTFEFLSILVKKQFTEKNINKFLLFFTVIIFISSFFRLIDPQTRMVYAGDNYCVDFFSKHLGPRAKVYIDNLPKYYYYFACSIDRAKKDYSYLGGIEPRFKYKIVDRLENADYIICLNSSSLAAGKFKLITTAGEYCLFKK